MPQILHIIPSFYPSEYYGGPAESAYHLCTALAKQGYKIHVLTTNADGPERIVSASDASADRGLDAISVHYCKRIGRGDFSIEQLIRLPAAILHADLVHVHAVFTPVVLVALFFSRCFGKPVVWTPRGALMAWGRKKKRILKQLWIAVVFALVQAKRSVVHATSDDEGSMLLQEHKGVQVSVVPNGVDLPSLRMRWDSRSKKRIAFLGRLDPIKGLENLLEACHLLLESSSAKTWQLDIYGGGPEAYQLKLASQLGQLGLSNAVTLRGPVARSEKSAVFSEMDLFVLPSVSENVGLVVVEALAHGVPVIASKGSPWKILEEKRCGWWTDNTPASLANAIAAALNEDLPEWGDRGRTLVEQDFSWDSVATKLAEIYQRLLAN
ncbi:MAG: glycosyltransferase [Myxococcales bacterium]|nr:MAG: glycosyltransferase [Myxococcales bacterium]